MVEFNTLSKDDQKTICELHAKQFKGEKFTNSDIKNLSIDGKWYMINELIQNAKIRGNLRADSRDL